MNEGGSDESWACPQKGSPTMCSSSGSADVHPRAVLRDRRDRHVQRPGGRHPQAVLQVERAPKWTRARLISCLHAHAESAKGHAESAESQAGSATGQAGSARGPAESAEVSGCSARGLAGSATGQVGSARGLGGPSRVKRVPRKVERGPLRSHGVPREVQRSPSRVKRVPREV